MTRRIDPLGLSALIVAVVLALVGYLGQLLSLVIIRDGSIPYSLFAAVLGGINVLLALTALVLGVLALVLPRRSRPLGAVGVAVGAFVLIGQLVALLSSVVLSAF